MNGTFYFHAEDGSDPITVELEGSMKRVRSYAKRVLPVAKFLYQNRKAEIALATALLALGREVVQIATGH